MVRSSYQRDDWCRLQLNDAVEDALSKILRFGFDIDHIEVKPATADALRGQIFAWAEHISREIPGYSNWQEIYDFTFEALCIPDAVPGSDATPIGTEADLVAELQDPDLKHAYALQDKNTEKKYLANHALSLSIARGRQNILDRIPSRYSTVTSMPHSLAQLFRKIRYTYKLRECLLGQVGYYSGSLELAAGMSDDFEYHMYLIQMKLRRPDRLHIFKAPKAMAYYITDPTSPLPWNNQFSFSYSYDKFGPQQMPIFGINYIERKLVDVLCLDVDGKKWRALCTLFNWNPRDPTLVGELHRIKTNFVSAETAAGASLLSAATHFLGGNLTLTDCGFHALTLPNLIMLTSSNEAKRKTFYTVLLGLKWSDMPINRKENPFFKEYTKWAKTSLGIGIPITYDLAHLKNDDVKDSRIATNQHALLTSNLAHYHSHTVGHKTNYILTPEVARANYHHKLEHLSEVELDQLFSNITTYPHIISHADKIDAIVNQATEAAQDWQTQAVMNHRPIHTGPSGYMLSCSRIFLSNIDPQGCVNTNHPTLEQLRLTLLATLIGFNQHHTYDECMIASHGLTHGGDTLKYMDHIGYRDIINSVDPFIRNKVGEPLLQAMITIGKQFITYFEEYQAMVVPPLPHPGPLVAQWFKDTTGCDFPGME